MPGDSSGPGGLRNSEEARAAGADGGRWTGELPSLWWGGTLLFLSEVREMHLALRCNVKAVKAAVVQPRTGKKGTWQGKQLAGETTKR